MFRNILLLVFEERNIYLSFFFSKQVLIKTFVISYKKSNISQIVFYNVLIWLYFIYIFISFFLKINKSYDNRRNLLRVSVNSNLTIFASVGADNFYTTMQISSNSTWTIKRARTIFKQWLPPLEVSKVSLFVDTCVICRRATIDIKFAKKQREKMRGRNFLLRKIDEKHDILGMNFLEFFIVNVATITTCYSWLIRNLYSRNLKSVFLNTSWFQQLH